MSKSNKKTDKLLIKEKRLKIIMSILIVLIIVTFLFNKIILLMANYRFTKNAPNYNYYSEAEYIEGKELKFIDCNDCEYIQQNEFSIPTKINDYILTTDEKAIKENETIIYKNAEEKMIMININQFPKGTRELEYNNFVRTYYEEFESDKNDKRIIKRKYNEQPSMYKMRKHMISFHDKSLRGSFFDSNKKLNEKTTIALLMIFSTPSGLNSIALCDYNGIEDIIEYKSVEKISSTNEEIAWFTYYFTTESSEYDVGIMGHELKPDETYLNYLKIKK